MTAMSKNEAHVTPTEKFGEPVCHLCPFRVGKKRSISNEDTMLTFQWDKHRKGGSDLEILQAHVII